MKHRNRFTYLQAEQIRLGRAHDLPEDEIRIYAKYRLNYLQMEQIRLALEEHLNRKDIRKIAHFWIPAERMKLLREEMKIGDRTSLHEALYFRRNRRECLFLMLSCTLMIVTFTMLVREMLAKDPEILLTVDETTLSVRDEFIPETYLSAAEDCILPQRKRMRGGGEYLAVYQTVFQGHRIARTLLVRFTDDEPPVLRLNAEEVSKQEYRDCLAYVERAYDAVSGDLRDDVRCSEPLDGLSEQEIVYTVRDRAGNEAVAFLRIVQAQSDAEREYWEALSRS
ncbi:MAG: hypothetical protein IKF51_07915 [Solobacterium sp.]|nr:hypothetical protein [Solobacterium sp.]